MWLFVAFLAVPLIEIALFIQIGGAIGLGWTLVTVVITAIIGTWLVRQQGLSTLNQLRNSFSDLRDPTEPLAHGAMILFSGALLLTPGFFTDSIGFLLLVPGVRAALLDAVRARIQLHTVQSGPAPQQPRRTPSQGEVIEGDYIEVAPEKNDTKRPSGWSDH